MTENTMPKALRYADMLGNGRWMNYADRNDAADELRRLHAVEQEAERLRAENEALKVDAARWREAVMHIGAENQLGRARYVIRYLQAPSNVMRGSVAEHFTETIDAARASTPQAS